MARYQSPAALADDASILTKREMIVDHPAAPAEDGTDVNENWNVPT